MRGVDEGERALLAGLGRRVVAQVGGEEGVHAGGADLPEEAVAGAAADGDGADDRVRVAGDADALGGLRQPGGGAGGELPQGLGVVEFADPAEAPAARGVAGVGDERSGDAQSEGAGEGVGDAGVGGVGVGVGDVQRDVVLDQRVHDAALEGAGLDGGGAAQIEGVVGDDQVGAQLHRLVDDVLHGVHGEQDAADLGVGIAADGSDGVPLLGPRGGPQDVQRGDDFGETGHRPRLPSVRERQSPYGVPGGRGSSRASDGPGHAPAPHSTTVPVATVEPPGGHPYV